MASHLGKFTRLQEYLKSCSVISMFFLFFNSFPLLFSLRMSAINQIQMAPAHLDSYLVPRTKRSFSLQTPRKI